jgi:hypothetical protein
VPTARNVTALSQMEQSARVGADARKSYVGDATPATRRSTVGGRPLYAAHFGEPRRSGSRGRLGSRNRKKAGTWPSESALPRAGNVPRLEIGESHLGGRPALRSRSRGYRRRRR